MMRLVILLALLGAAVPARAQTYFAALNQDGSIARLAEADASGAAVPTDGSCPGCQVVTQAQYQAYQAQIAAAAQAATGSVVTLTSASTPALNGTYAVDPVHTAQINAVATYIQSTTTPGQAPGTGATFPTGATTMPWIDTSGVPS